MSTLSPASNPLFYFVSIKTILGRPSDAWSSKYRPSNSPPSDFWSLNLSTLWNLSQWLVSSIPFRFPFNLPVLIYNSGSSPFSICKWLVQKDFNNISKFVCCGFYIKKNVAFKLISFAVLKWDECLSVQLPFELTVQITV